MKMNENENKKNIVKIKGMLSRILFPRPANDLGKNDSSSFGITVWEVIDIIEGKLKDESNVNGIIKITVKGDFGHPINDGKVYIILGQEIIDEKYGLQYELLSIREDIDLENVNQIWNFLKDSNVLNGSQLKEMKSVYENPLPYIKNHDIEALSKVKGVGKYIAQCIIDRYEDNKDNSLIYIKLSDIGLTPAFIKKLIKEYKNPEKIVDIVKNNPYKLTYDIDGIGFKTADKIALKGGLSPTSVDRVSAYVKYHLEKMKNDGYGYLTAIELIQDIYNNFDGKANIYEDILDENGNVVNNNINISLENLQKEKIIIIEDNEKKAKRRIYLREYYYLESSIAKDLIRIKDASSNFVYNDWEQKIKEQEERQGFSFTQEQLDGIKLGLDSQVCFITGLAGTGKSTLVSGILASLDNYSFSQCALSGKAASRLQEVTGQDGKTIHRLLEYNPQLGFVRNRDNPLDDSIIILDELSLVGEDIFNKLLEAIPDGTKLVLLGDMGQLESIGEGNLAYDIYQSGLIPVVELTKVQRQAQKSGIITTAHDVRNQENLFEDDYEGKLTFGELKDMHFDTSDSYENDRKKCVDYFKRLYQSNIVKKNIMEIQLISPVKERGDTCVFNLNKDVQHIYNPKTKENEKECIEIKISKDKSFEIRKNDKVMCIKNNYKTMDINGETCPIFNGWMGIVQGINKMGDLVVDFQLTKNPIIIPKRQIKSELVLGYASTVHKCISGDTFIFTNDGIKKIKDIKNNWENIKIFNGTYMEAPSSFFENEILPCRSFTTRRGYQITGLLEHVGVILNKKGEFEKKEFKDICKDDYVVLRKNQRIFGNTIELPNKYFEIPEQNNRTAIYKLPRKMSEDFAMFLGFMVADGVIGNHGIKLGKKDEDYVKIFCDIVKNIFGYEAKYKKLLKTNMYLTEINSTFIRDFCRNIDGLLPNKKDIPQIILESDMKYQVKFLSVLFEDGNINLKKDNFDHIEFISKDKELVNKVNMMLLNMGIIATSRTKKSYLKKYNKYYNSFCLYIYKQEAKVFRKEINFISNKNLLKIKSLDKETMRNDRIGIPFLKTRIKKFLEKNNIVLPMNLKKSINKNSNDEKITLNFLKKIIDCIPIELHKEDEVIFLKSLIDDYLIEKIEDIEELEEKTYCVEMPKTHMFIQNGFYFSNCQGSSADAIIGVINYTTPPSMLTSQLLYTLMTRAKKQCIIIGQNKAINQAINTDFVSQKRTFLPELLINKNY